jgi:glycosyltransferase involved in cell wall biosynthesis
MTHRTRILLLIPSMASAGGTERMVDGLSRLFAEAGLTVAQATFDPPGCPRHFEGPTACHRLGPIPRLPLPLRGFAYLLAAWRLRRLKSRLQIEVTISNLWGADLINVLAGGPGRRFALCHINVVGNHTNRLMVRLRPLVGAVYRRFDRVIAVSEPLARELKWLYRLAPKRIDYINNFVNLPKTVSKLPADGVKRFVWCGRFVQEKNVAGLLHAWSCFASGGQDRVQLVLLGDGPERLKLLELSQRLGLRIGFTLDSDKAQVIFQGMVRDPTSFMIGARALILSSYAEGFGLVVLEALTTGIPVLASDCLSGGVRAVLQGKGQCDPVRLIGEQAPGGVLLPVPNESVSTTLAIWVDWLRRLTNDEDYWMLLKQGALERARCFDSSVVRDQWLKALDISDVIA